MTSKTKCARFAKLQKHLLVISKELGSADGEERIEI